VHSVTDPVTTTTYLPSTTFRTQLVSVSTSTDNVPSSVVSAHLADGALSLHNLFLTYAPFPIELNHWTTSPVHPRGTPEEGDAGIGLLLQKDRYGTHNRPPGMLDERSPFPPTAGFLPSIVEASRSDLACPLHTVLVGMANEKDLVDRTSSGSETIEERAQMVARFEEQDNLLAQKCQCTEGAERTQEICGRRGAVPPEGAVRLWVRVSSTVVGPSNRTDIPLGSGAALGRGHSHLGGASSTSGMGAADPRTTPVDTITLITSIQGSFEHDHRACRLAAS
jgi:hypothetical protein